MEFDDLINIFNHIEYANKIINELHIVIVELFSGNNLIMNDLYKLQIYILNIINNIKSIKPYFLKIKKKLYQFLSIYSNKPHIIYNKIKESENNAIYAIKLIIKFSHTLNIIDGRKAFLYATKSISNIIIALVMCNELESNTYNNLISLRQDNEKYLLYIENYTDLIHDEKKIEQKISSYKNSTTINKEIKHKISFYKNSMKVLPKSLLYSIN